MVILILCSLAWLTDREYMDFDFLDVLVRAELRYSDPFKAPLSKFTQIMTSKRPFTFFFFASIVVQAAIRAPYDRMRRDSGPKTDSRVSTTEKALLSAMALGTFVPPVIYTWTTWLDAFGYGLDASSRSKAGWVGTGLLVGSLWLFWKSHHDSEANWSPSLEVGEKQTLITKGIYSIV